MSDTRIEGQVIIGQVSSGSITYTIRVHCDDKAETMRAAFNNASIACNTKARAGKIKNGEVYEVTPLGTIHKTTEQMISDMTPEARKQLLDALIKSEQKA